jgi:hypothetical protein
VYIITHCSSLNRTTFFSLDVCRIPDPTKCKAAARLRRREKEKAKKVVEREANFAAQNTKKA